MRPMPRFEFSLTASRSAAAVAAGLAASLPVSARAADGGIFSGATISASVAVIVAICLLLAAVHYRRRLGEAETRATDLEIRLEREQALVETSPQAIIC